MIDREDVELHLDQLSEALAAKHVSDATGAEALRCHPWSIPH